MSSSLTQWRYFRNILRNHLVTVTPSSPHTVHRHRTYGNCSVWTTIEQCRQCYLGTTALSGKCSRWLSIPAYPSLCAHMAKIVAPNSFHYCEVNHQSSRTCWEAEESLGEPDLVSNDLKELRAMEQAVVPTNLGSAPSATPILHLIHSCYKPGSLMSRAGISGNIHADPCSTTLRMSLYKGNWERKQFRRAASFGHRETSLSRVPLPPATSWSRNLTPWLSYVPQLGDVNNPGLIFNLHLAEGNGASELLGTQHRGYKDQPQLYCFGEGHSHAFHNLPRCWRKPVYCAPQTGTVTLTHITCF